MRRRATRAAGLLAVTVAFGLTTGATRAAVLAADDAARAAYNAGWTNGSNGGSGFGPWSLSPQPNSNNAGFFVGSSANNGDGGGQAPPPGDIDVAGESWGLYANNGQTADAVRPLTGALDVGQRITFRFDNGWIDDGGRVGFEFDSATEDRLTVFFVGGQQNYTINDSSGLRDTGIGFTDEGMAVDLLLTGPDSYSLTLTPAGSLAVTFTGDMVGPVGSGIEAIHVFNDNAGSFSQRDVFVNSLAVIPEPGALGGLMVAAVALRRRR